MAAFFRHIPSWVVVLLAGTFAIAACAPSAQPQAAPQPAQPAAPPAPAAQPAAKPAAEPAKPAAQPAKPAAQPAKPAAQPAKPSGPVIELRAGMSHPPGGIMGNSVDKFAELVSQKTGGQVVVRNFHQALGVEHQLTQSVMSGSVDIGGISGGNAGRFTSAWFVYDLPFLFKSYPNVYKSLDGPIGKKAIEQFEKDLGIKMLFPMDLGSGRDIFSRNKPLKSPADVKGLKFRVVSTPVDLATFKAWGANPTPVDWAQTYAALQQGVVDGMQPEIGAVLTGKFYEVVKYGVRLDYQALWWNFYINGKKFDSLAPEHQKAIMEAATEAKAYNQKAAQDYLKEVIKSLTGHGMTIHTPTPQEYNQWAAIREKVWEEVAEQQKGKIDLNLAKQIYEAQ